MHSLSSHKLQQLQTSSNDLAPGSKAFVQNVWQWHKLPATDKLNRRVSLDFIGGIGRLGCEFEEFPVSVTSPNIGSLRIGSYVSDVLTSWVWGIIWTLHTLHTSIKDWCRLLVLAYQKMASQLPLVVFAVSKLFAIGIGIRTVLGLLISIQWPPQTNDFDFSWPKISRLCVQNLPVPALRVKQLVLRIFGCQFMIWGLANYHSSKMFAVLGPSKDHLPHPSSGPEAVAAVHWKASPSPWPAAQQMNASGVNLLTLYSYFWSCK